MRFTYGDVMRNRAGFAADVAQVIRKPVSPLLPGRLAWMDAPRNGAFRTR
jgi:hypothetical protein